MNLLAVIFSWMLVILLVLCSLATGAMGEPVKCMACAVASLILTGRALRIGEAHATNKERIQRR